jgi:thiamine biosynthesis lipoprotein
MKASPEPPELRLRLDDPLELANASRLIWTLGEPSPDSATAHVSFRAMGCAVRAEVDSDDPQAEAQLRRVPEWFETWEARLSRFRPQSELSRLNGLAGEMVEVSPILWEVIQAAVEAARISDGLVTPAVLPCLEAAGYDRPFAEMDRDRPEPAACPVMTADWRAIHFESKSRRLRLPAGSRLDLGGIGKGWAAERAARRLGHLGPALVEAGGDIALSGRRRRGEAWRISVADPRQPDRDMAHLSVPSGGIATSGMDYRRWRRAGVWHHHLIDPRTGRPAESDVWSATVVGPSLQVAETAAKVTVILGADAGLDWIERRPTLAALLVLQDGTRRDSRRLRNVLRGS